MAEPKTKMTDDSVEAYLAAILDAQRREDCRAVAAIMKKAAKAEPKMWGSAIVGFGLTKYVYESGRTGEWPLIGFSSRKNAITLYLKLGSGNADELLPRLGKYTTGKGCLYLKRLSDVDTGVLAKIVAASVAAGASSRID